MLDQTQVLIVVAIATLVLPAVFLAVLAIAARRRSRGQGVGDNLIAAVTALGGASLGVMVLMGDDLRVTWPILGAVVVIGGLLLRRGSVRLLGAFLAGAAAPWSIVGTLSVVSLVLGEPLEAVRIWTGFIVGTVLLLLGVFWFSARPGPGAGPRSRPAGAAGRSFADVGAATRAPAFVGPFGLSEVALLATLVGSWIVVSFVLASASLPEPVNLAILVVVSSVLGAEAYIRAMPRPAREAFEAFSWLGEWELGQIRALTGGGMPTTSVEARRWLRAHPETTETRWIRVEMLTFARQYDEAQAAAERMPDATPQERFDRAVTLDFVDWFRGGDGDVPSLEAAARELLPADGDDRLRAEVIIAIADVRRRMAAGEDPIQAGQALRDVRKRLGARANGQVGRALRMRLIKPLLVVGAVLALVALLVPDLAPIL
jgi:hypothetical protein